MNWVRNDHGGWRSESHYVGQTNKRFWRVWAGNLKDGYKQLPGVYASAAMAKASVE